MSYINTLSSVQKKNIETIIVQAIKSGIINPHSIAGILAIISKETQFIPKSENLNYSAKRLQEVFKLSPERANQLVGKPEAIGNAVYGGKYGNALNEGYKYRGRGFNQLTFKGNYKKYGRLIGTDIVANPDMVNEVETASKVLMSYNKEQMEALRKSGKLAEYNAKDINDFKNPKDATLGFYHVTAGVGKSVDRIKALLTNDSLGGMKKAQSRATDLYNYVESFLKKKPNLKSKKGISIGYITLGMFLILGTAVIYKYRGYLQA
jgi:putative chitinase